VLGYSAITSRSCDLLRLESDSPLLQGLLPRAKLVDRVLELDAGIVVGHLRGSLVRHFISTVHALAEENGVVTVRVGILNS